MLLNIIILAIRGHDTLRPLGIQFMCFANNMLDIKYHKQCSALGVGCSELLLKEKTNWRRKNV